MDHLTDPKGTKKHSIRVRQVVALIGYVLAVVAVLLIHSCALEADEAAETRAVAANVPMM